MDRRRSFYLVARQDDFDVPDPDEPPVDLTDIATSHRLTTARGVRAACHTAAECSFAV
jgi:hypothetical protein